MSYDSPSNDLDNNEVCKYLKLSNKLNVVDLIKWDGEKNEIII